MTSLSAGPVLAPVFENASWASPAATQAGGVTSTAPATPTTITWSFASNPGSVNDPFSGYLDAQYQATVAQAFQAWQNVANINFVEVPDSEASDIRVGWGDFNTASTGQLGLTSLEQSQGAIQPGAIIRLEDPSQTALTTDAGGTTSYSGTDTTLYQLVLHEIGHAIGLADNSDPSSIEFALSSGSNRTLDQTDIAGAQALYGAPTPTPQPATLSITPALAASSSIDVSQTNLAQLVQAMINLAPQQASASSNPIVTQFPAQVAQLAMATH